MLVGVSTLLHWLAGRRFDGLWILPDEALYVGRAADLWNHGTIGVFHGTGAGYGLLYPMLLGFPLSVGDLETGYHSLKLLQALVVSLAAVPVAVWSRRLMPFGWGVVAAALTLASPVLLYSGLVMTEVLFYPLAALALYAIADAVEHATARSQLLAFAAIAATVLTRSQGVIFVGVFAAAVLLDAAFAREWRRLRRFWPLWAITATAVVVAAAAPTVFGSYSNVVRGGYPVADGLELTVEHIGWAVVSTGVVPAAALVVLAIDAVRGRERDASVRALVAVALSALVLVSLQVGFFAARFAPHLLERDLACLPPVLFLAFCVWLARARATRLVVAGSVAFGVLALVVLLPWDELVDIEALPDSFSLVTLYRLREHDPALIAGGFALVLLAAFALLPVRWRVCLPVLVGVALVTTSVVAADNVASRIAYDRTHLVGSPRDWIDRGSGGRRVAYVYDGEAYFNGVWQARAWNSSIDRVIALAPTRVPGPLQQEVRKVAPDGEIGAPERYVAATDGHTFRGEAVAHADQIDADGGGTTLWRVDRPARLSTVIRGVQVNGDMTEPGQITVYDCGGGHLDLTLLPKETQIVVVELDGAVRLRERIAGLPSWTGSVPVPPSKKPRVCRFTIGGQGLLGSTRIEFVHG